MIAAVILAAGRSRRMGRPKMSLPWKDGTTLIAHMVSIFQDADAEPIVVVAGENCVIVEELLRGLEVNILANPETTDAEMLDSVKIGLKSLDIKIVEAVLIMPGDHPLLLPSTVCALCAAWRGRLDRIIAPSFGGRRGHPLLIPNALWPEILALGEGVSLRDFLNRYEADIEYLVVEDPGVRFDVDTPEDYENALRA
jgi:molybdenum cofactor cytidylyltransferase